MNFKPLHDFILIEKPETPDQIGNIFLPEVSIERSVIAEVLAVGPGRRTKNGITPVSVKPGDKIVINKSTGETFKIDDKEVILIKEENIITKLV